MSFEFKLPDIGEGTVEGEVVRWLAEVGEQVAPDQPVVEVMTDKATVELTAPCAGTLTELRAKAGEVVPVGQVLYVLERSGGGAAGGSEVADAEAKGTGTSASLRSQSPAPSTSGRKPLATPATRKLARELGVDLASVSGTGPVGRITSDDVRRAASGGGSQQASAPPPASAPPQPTAAPPPSVQAPVFATVSGQETTERLPFRGVRKAVAAQMVRSKFTATHYTYVEEVDMSEIVQLRRAEKARLAALGVKLTYLPFIVKAVTHALKQFPLLNAELDEAAQEILLKRYYHMGISIDAPAGLSVGVVRHADQRSVGELAVEIDRLVQSIRAGRAKREDLTGSTFTITSAGNLGGVLATPIINFPEVAILGVNAIRKRPVVIEGPEGDAIAVRQMMNLALSLDHRVVDGAVAARFMNEVVAVLEHPHRLLIGM